jgi:osmotically inducible protein OsmC
MKLGSGAYDTTARVHLGEGPKITEIELNTEAEVPGIGEKTFLECAENSKRNRPVSQALAATPIKLNAKLTG